MICDNKTGQCLITPATDSATLPSEHNADQAVIVHYVGDPMCSWCWGISESVKALEAWCLERGYRLELTNGGLRAGGGDAWNAAFRRFLRDEWQHIHSVTGQPFSYSLLERDAFNYDTEPPCRAVVSATLIRHDVKLAFFRETQRKFYTEAGDPKDIAFYQSICEKTAIAFADFSAVFASQRAALATQAEFFRARQLGVNAFPSILLEKSGVIHKVASGYISGHDLIKRLCATHA